MNDCKLAFIPRQYVGITYPRIFDNRVAQWLWLLLCCPRQWHLWDEVLASGQRHVLVCDACSVEFGHDGEVW